MLPKIKSDLERLEDTASFLFNRVQNNGTVNLGVEGSLQAASDIRGAIQDIQNLRDELHNLNNKIWKASRDLNDFSLELAK